jgi:hypothetical protein
MLNGVLVDFPNQAYPTQLSMMSKVIGALKMKQNALLESPTGTGLISFDLHLKIDHFISFDLHLKIYFQFIFYILYYYNNSSTCSV